jgi:hypothetical protein
VHLFVRGLPSICGDYGRAAEWVATLRRIDAGVHLGEPAQTSALRGHKTRPKGDRADAKHLRELLLIGKLPESQIPPDHLPDLRAKVRLRHALVDQRGEWQQRIRSASPQRVASAQRRRPRWLEQVDVPDAAREQRTRAACAR